MLKLALQAADTTLMYLWGPPLATGLGGRAASSLKPVLPLANFCSFYNHIFPVCKPKVQLYKQLLYLVGATSCTIEQITEHFPSDGKPIEELITDLIIHKTKEKW